MTSHKEVINRYISWRLLLSDTGSRKVIAGHILFLFYLLNINIRVSAQEINRPSSSSVTMKDSLSAAEYIKAAERSIRSNTYDSAFYYVEKGVALDGETPSQTVALISMKGTTHYYLADYQAAIRAHLQAMEVCDRFGLDMDRARVFNNLGIAYIRLEDWDKAEKNMLAALRISREFYIKRGELYCLGNLGIIYKNQNKIPKAIHAYEESIAINRLMEDQHSLSRNLNNRAALYHEEHRYEEAMVDYRAGLDIGIALGDDHLMATGYQNIASIHTDLESFMLAEKNYKLGLVLAEKIKAKDLQTNALKGLSILYEKRGDFLQALDYFRQFQTLKDSVISERSLATIRELEVKYDTEKKEKELLQLSKQTLADQTRLLSIESHNRLLVFGIFTLLILFSALFIIYRQYMGNKRKKDQLTAISETQNEERKRIAQDLHDSVGGSLAAIKMRMDSCAHRSEENSKELEELALDLSKTADQLRQISHDIMPGELLRFGLVSAIQTSLDQMGNKSLRSQIFSHAMDERLDPTVELHLFRIIQEAIQNTLRHAGANRIDIYLNKHPKSIDLLIEDDGKGMEDKKTTGLGLNSIHDRVKQMGGTFTIDSALGRGTTLSIKVPLR